MAVCWVSLAFVLSILFVWFERCVAVRYLSVPVVGIRFSVCLCLSSVSLCLPSFDIPSLGRVDRGGVSLPPHPPLFSFHPHIF